MVVQMWSKKLLIIVFLLIIPTVFGLFDDEIFLMAVNLREGKNIDLNPDIITTQGTISLVDNPDISGDLTIGGGLIIGGDLLLLGDLSFLGDIVNVTIINQNVTGQLTISGSLISLRNVSGKNIFQNGNRVNDSVDLTPYNSSINLTPYLSTDSGFSNGSDIRTGDIIINGTAIVLDTSGRALMNATSTYVSFPGIAGIDNNIIGEGAGASLLSTGTDNTCIGDLACDSLTSGDNNVAIGADSLGAMTTGGGGYAVAVGKGALSSATNAGAVGIGYNAGSSFTSGINGIFIGNNANTGDGTGIGQIAIGATTVTFANGITIGLTSHAGPGGISIGTDAGATQDVADVDNVLIGYQAGTAISGTGTDNTIVGDSAGTTLTSGDGNIIIGADADVATTTTNTIVIGFGASCNFNSGGAFGFGATCKGNNMLSIGSPTNNLDTTIYGSFNATKRIFANLSHVFGLATKVHTVAVVDTWYNITMNRTFADVEGFSLSPDNVTIIIPNDAHYTLTIGMGIIDSAVTPDAHVAMRVSVNEAELAGSYIEHDTEKFDSDNWLEHTTHAELSKGDEIILQYISDATTVTIDQHDTYAETPFTAFGYIQEIISSG